MNLFNEATVRTFLFFAFLLVLLYLMKIYSPIVNLHIQFTIIYLHKFYSFIEKQIVADCKIKTKTRKQTFMYS